MELTYDYIKKERAKYLALADLLISGWKDINTMPVLNRIEETVHFTKVQMMLIYLDYQLDIEQGSKDVLSIDDADIKGYHEMIDSLINQNVSRELQKLLSVKDLSEEQIWLKAKELGISYNPHETAVRIRKEMNDFLPEFENLPVIEFLKAARTHYFELHPDKNTQKVRTKRIKRPEDPVIIKQKKLRTRHYKEAMCAGSYEITGTEGICSYGGYTFKFIYEHCVDNRDVPKSMKNKTKDNYEVYYDLRRLADNKKLRDACYLAYCILVREKN